MAIWDELTLLAVDPKNPHGLIVGDGFYRNYFCTTSLYGNSRFNRLRR